MTVRLVTGLAVCALYFWIIGIGAEHQRFALQDHSVVSGSNNVDGYYDMLGRAFAHGHLRLSIEPAPALLALPDPWSDRMNRPYRILDAVLYKRHYYLYHGATPALLLFTPFYLITRHDLPENFAAFLFALGGYLFLSALFARALAALSIRLPVSLYALFLTALGVAQSTPFLLHRVKVYEVAIACGYFCLSSGFYFTFRLRTDSRRSLLWAALAGLSFGLAIGARPHLGIASVAVLVLLILQGRVFRKHLLAFLAPVIFCGLAILAYNYARFDKPLEFGTRYLMGNDAYRNFHLSTSNFERGAYYLLVCPPEIVPEFPFVRLALGDPLDSFTRDLTAGYFLEPIGGVLSVCPILLVIFFLPLWRELWNTHRAVFGLLAAMLATVAGTVLVLVSVPFSSQRYDVDFLPYLLFVACVIGSIVLTTIRRKSLRIVVTIGLTAMLLYSVTANLALGIQGPYDQFVQSSPSSYVNLARWFSPIERFRPLLNPALHIAAVFDFIGPCPASKQPLISTGEFGSRYMLSAQCAGEGRIRLISQDSILNPDERSVEVPFTSQGSYEIGLDYTPNDHFVTVTWNHNIVLRYPLRFLVTSRSQVHLGWDPSMGNQNTFQGRIKLLPSWIWDTRE